MKVNHLFHSGLQVLLARAIPMLGDTFPPLGILLLPMYGLTRCLPMVVF